MAERTPRGKGKAVEPRTFEAAFAALEERARLLEQGNLPLEESLALYEEGAALVDELRGILATAELRIRKTRAQVAEETNVLHEPGPAYEDDGEFEDYAEDEDEE